MADMVPHEVEPAKGVGRAPHDAAGEIVLAQIADETEGAAARAGDLADHGVDPRLIDVDDSDSGTFAGEAKRAGPPHPRGRRRDDADFAVEPHCFLPFFRAPSLPSPACGREGRGSSGDVLAVVERVERRAVGLADHMSLDLQGRRHLTVGYRKGFRGDREMPHPLDG